MRRVDNPVQNRSLERGLEILRAFRPGGALKTNSEFAERTGLPRSTVSRLTQTLVACRFLERDEAANAYRLGASVLSLAETFLTDSEVLPYAIPLMKSMSDDLRANVGLAVPDGDEMVYLHAIRCHGVGMPRYRTAGYRVPTLNTALGRAYLATLEMSDRERLLQLWRSRSRKGWSELKRDVEQAVRQVQRLGYCRAQWLPDITALGAPFKSPRGVTHVVNVSFVTAGVSRSHVRDVIAPRLLRLASSLGDMLASPVKAR